MFEYIFIFSLKLQNLIIFYTMKNKTSNLVQISWAMLGGTFAMFWPPAVVLNFRNGSLMCNQMPGRKSPRSAVASIISIAIDQIHLLAYLGIRARPCWFPALILTRRSGMRKFSFMPGNISSRSNETIMCLGTCARPCWFPAPISEWSAAVECESSVLCLGIYHLDQMKQLKGYWHN